MINFYGYRRTLSLLFLVFIGSCNKKESDNTLFALLSQERTGIHFKNEIEETEEFNIQDFLYFYNGGGIAAGDINNDGLIDLYFTSNQGGNKLYLNKGGLEFENITQQAKVGGEEGVEKWITSATMVDINNDGFLDIYVCEVNGYLHLNGKNKLFVNNGDLSFTENASEFGLDIATFSQQAAFFDADNDGDLDLFLVNLAAHTPNSYKRADARTIKDSLAGDLFFLNEEGIFIDKTEEAGIHNGSMGYGLAVNIEDINLDGYPDIYVSNDFHENDYMYYNNGNGTFKEAISSSTKHNSTFSMGADIADFNNDGRPDIFTLDMKPEDEVTLKTSAGEDSYDVYNYKLHYGYHYQYPRNMLQLNRGHLFDSFYVNFSEIAQLKGVSATDWSWSASFADLDNSGFKDLFITNGIPRRPNNLDFTNYVYDKLIKDGKSEMQTLSEMPDGIASNYVFKNEAGSFLDKSKEWGLDFRGYSNGALVVDLDNDGDLDVVVNNLNETASVFENHTTDKLNTNFLKIKLLGNKKNKNGIGARVTIYIKDSLQTQYNNLTSGWLSSENSQIVHFGLGRNTLIDSLEVRWPDKSREVIKKVKGNSELIVKQENAKKIKENPLNNLFNKELVNITAIAGINYEHKENPFNDFSKEKLLPRLLSTEGPKIAVADINGDGLDDFFVTGAKGQPGELYIQNRMGEQVFKKVTSTLFQDHRFYEDTAAIFFDVDNDGDQDLFVASGGGEISTGILLKDRLYINNGKGEFSYSQDKQVPNSDFNSSCVVPLDVNDDGFLDLFVGNRSIPGLYGIPGLSKLYLNQADGHFVDATDSLFKEGGNIGMVTDASWVQGEKKLLVVGEWMPVSLFKLKDGYFKRNNISNSGGWWKTIESVDINNDGISEFLLGNAGLNTGLEATENKPIDLYGDSNSDPIMAYYRNGKQWPYPSLKLLAEQMVGINKAFRTFESYANSSFTEVFPEKVLEEAYHSRIQTLASSLLQFNGEDYDLKPLPEESQYAEVNAFICDDLYNDGDKEIIAAGNFYGYHPSIGRSDASYGTVLALGADGIKQHSGLKTGFALDGEVRDMKILNSRDKTKIIIVALNNKALELFSYQ